MPRGRTIVGYFIILAIVILGDGVPESVRAGVVVAPVPPAQTPAFTAAADYVSGEVLVKFKGTAPSRTPRAARAAVADLPAVPTQARVALDRVQGRVIRNYTWSGAQLVSFSDTRSVPEIIADLQASGAVEYAEPNYRVYAVRTPNDPSFSQLWALHNTGQAIWGANGTADADMDASAAWNVIRNAASTIVAVIDTGVDYTHEDLAANIWRNPGEIPDNNLDDDGNGYTDDVYGINAILGDGDPMDDNDHGTHCAGIIGAEGNNGVGVAGVAWQARIMALKFMGASGSGTIGDAIECIQYALAMKQVNGYRRMVLSNSWGSSGNSTALFDTIKAAQDAGVLFTAAAGNQSANNDSTPFYPASFNLANIISVGASDFRDKVSFFSNFGVSTVDVFAPGEDILSTVPGSSYAYFSGTSMATPEVAGTCALVWSQNRTSGWRGVKGLILNGTENGQASAFQGKCVTGGRINVNASLQASLLDDPAVFTISPSRATAGSRVVVTGTNFGTTAGTLHFAGANLPADAIVSWKGTVIAFYVPAGTPPGAGLLQVVTPNGTSRGGFLQVE